MSNKIYLNILLFIIFNLFFIGCKSDDEKYLKDDFCNRPWNENLKNIDLSEYVKSSEKNKIGNFDLSFFGISTNYQSGQQLDFEREGEFLKYLVIGFHVFGDLLDPEHHIG